MIYDNELRKNVYISAIMRALTEDKEEAKISIANQPTNQQTHGQKCGHAKHKMRSTALHLRVRACVSLCVHVPQR